MRVDGAHHGEERCLPLGRGAAPRPNVLLVATAGERPSAALKYAAELASCLRGELHVLQRMPRSDRLTANADGRLSYAEACRRIERCVAACRETRQWCQRVLDEPLPTRRLRLLFGEAVRIVAARATELDAAFVVLAPSHAAGGADDGGEAIALRLGQACSRPVVVARARAPRARHG